LVATQKSVSGKKNMKTKFTTIKSLARYLRLGAAAGAVLLSCGLPLHARAAAFDSPVGSWDISMSGGRSGLAVMQFNSDNTFAIYEIVVPNQTHASSGTSDDSRGTGGDDSRSGSTGGSNGPVVLPITNLFGGELSSSGLWGFDTHGRLIGFYGEALGEVCATNTVTITNGINGTIPGEPPGFVTNVMTVTCVSTTNAVSFVGSVVPGKRLTLSARIISQKIVYNGLPAIQLTNFAGTGFGNRIEPGQNTTEFFLLSPDPGFVEVPMLNFYDVVGGGGNYTYSVDGHALVSRWNKIAFSLPLDPDQAVLRATIGSANARKLIFNTQGWEQQPGPSNRHIKFTGAITPPAD
jgi:hypothetical protein